jgi:hypothetical protein
MVENNRWNGRNGVRKSLRPLPSNWRNGVRNGELDELAV